MALHTKQVQVDIEFEKLSIFQKDLAELAARELGIEGRIKELLSASSASRSKTISREPRIEQIAGYKELDEQRAKVKAEIRRLSAQRDTAQAALRALDPDTSQLLDLPSADLRAWAELYLPKDATNEKVRQGSAGRCSLSRHLGRSEFVFR
ncbi:MAG TPA: hypothetical protein VFA90_11500 [Terriglobales bacterium]|nr:hypothetical protein [Terriglobales bacterium]